MPIVTIDRDNFFQELGKTYSEEEFRTVCFEFGIELDDIVVVDDEDSGNESKSRKEKGSKLTKPQKTQFKIDIPANRYDLLCEEGLIQALRIFYSMDRVPQYITSLGKLKMIVDFDTTSKIRPYMICAVLRGVSFTKRNFQSFISLQDKLHQNICRKRSLVSVGTHDLNTVVPPFSYEALPPEKINFIPLDETKSFNGKELMEYYMSGEKHLKNFVHLIKGSPVYPVVLDSKQIVMSLPPIINSEHSKLTLNTRDVFIDCTATDLTKAHIVMNTLVTLFSKYCSNPFHVEQVEVLYRTSKGKDVLSKIKAGLGVIPDVSDKNTLSSASIEGKDGVSIVVPNLQCQKMKCKISELQSLLGVREELNEVTVKKLLQRMQLESSKIQHDRNAGENAGSLMVDVPPTRCDILHPRDIYGAVGIAYGYNKIPKTLPNLMTIGKQTPLNKLTELLRVSLACMGYTEVLTLILCSHQENFEFLNKVDPDEKQQTRTAVVLSNPKTVEFQVVRTSLLPGMLKSLQHNIKLGVPMSIFEISDVVSLVPATSASHISGSNADSINNTAKNLNNELGDVESDVGARNSRHLTAIYCDISAKFEVIHGLLDDVMTAVGVRLNPEEGYSLQHLNEPYYFKNYQAAVIYKGKRSIGSIGILHPKVVFAYGLKYPCSVLDLNVEALLEIITSKS